MRILSRYILKEISSHSLLGLLVFTSLIFIRHVGQLLELVVRHDLPVSEVIKLFLLPMPSILVLTIPMAVLVGILIGLSRMATDGEVIAARASGIGLPQFVRPVMVFALIGWGLASWMSLFLAPQSARELNRMESALRASQAPYQIQPRVFIEQFPNLLLYIEDITGARSEWHGVFIADTANPNAMKVTVAERGMLVNNPASGGLLLHLAHGTTHEYNSNRPKQYSVASFNSTDIPITIPHATHGGAERLAPKAMPLLDLIHLVGNPARRQAALVELHYRFALPLASLVLAMVGIPLGLYTRKGGKALGLMLTILLVFAYYIVMAFGLSFAKQGRLPPAVGLWLANTIFAVAGMLMLSGLPGREFHLPNFLQNFYDRIVTHLKKRRAKASRHAPGLASSRPHPAGYPLFQILDIYMFSGWVMYLLILVAAFTGVGVIFDFFQLLGDIIRNHIGATTVLSYYRYLLPQIIYFPVLPLSILVATLVSFGLLTKTNQITAIKSAGISLYRISAPILLAAALLSVGLFIMGEKYLPRTNQRRDELRNMIKGRPPQTYSRPDRQWIFGKSNRIYNYRFFDPDRNVFANLSVFEFSPHSFQMTRRIWADRAFWEPAIHGWVLENGWMRNLEGGRVTSYFPFSVATFKELSEEPAYFKKEVKPSEQMSALELRRYINGLRQSGFNVVRLTVQFYSKFAFPASAFVVALLGIPFSFSTGKKGALSGVALSIGIAITYWWALSLFETMGNLSQLPPIVAAWAPDFIFGLGGLYLLLRVRT